MMTAVFQRAWARTLEILVVLSAVGAVAASINGSYRGWLPVAIGLIAIFAFLLLLYAGLHLLSPVSPPATSHSNWGKSLLVISGAFASASLLFTVYGISHRPWSPTPSGKSAAEIVQVKTVTYVAGTPGQYKVSGSLIGGSSQIDHGRTLWIANRPHRDDELHLSDAKVAFSFGPCAIIEDTFECNYVFLGTKAEIGHVYDIFPVLLSSQDANDLVQTLRLYKQAVDLQAPSGADAGPVFQYTRKANETDN